MKSQASTTEQEPMEIDPSKFAFAVTRIASAQICQSVGFTSTQRSALDTLTEVAARYLRALADSAAASTASSGRTQSNLYDVVRALENLGSVHGFPGAWEVNRTLLASSTLVDLSRFVECTDEIPFAKPIPPRPPSPEKAVSPANPTAAASHIPRWLPAFPEMGKKQIDDGKETLEVERGGNVDGGGCLVGEKMKMGLLPEKRGSVRFKMGKGKGGGEVGEGFVGVDLSGVCRGGKRVSCQNKNVHREEDHREKKSSDIPGKRRGVTR